MQAFTLCERAKVTGLRVLVLVLQYIAIYDENHFRWVTYSFLKQNDAMERSNVISLYDGKPKTFIAIMTSYHAKMS